MNDIDAIVTLKELNENYFSEEHDEANEAIETAISSLEKQVPRKPISVGKLHIMLRCPNCKCEVEDLIMQMGYCEHCGQAIDWS